MRRGTGQDRPETAVYTGRREAGSGGTTGKPGKTHPGRVKSVRNYDVPDLSTARKAALLGEGIALTLVIDYLFYESWPALLFLLPLSFFYLRLRIKEAVRIRKRTLNIHFKDALVSLSLSVEAGYSLENAVMSCRRDLEKIYPPDSDICTEFRYFESQLKLSVPVENLFLDFGRRSSLEDVRNFAVVLALAKRTGGETGRILQKCAAMVGDKIDVQREIEALVAARKMEQTIMSIMPAAIIVYLKLTSPGFLSVLYGNLLGACMMTACLGVYAGAWMLGRKMTAAGR